MEERGSVVSWAFNLFIFVKLKKKIAKNRSNLFILVLSQSKSVSKAKLRSKNC